MTFAARLLSATIGRAVSRYRTLGDWATIYRQIIDSRPIDPKTKANRRCSLGHVLDGIGEDRIISTIRPHEIGAMVMAIHREHEPLAKRVLIEAKDFFSEAINYGWIDRNPASPVKSPQVHVMRHRLTLEQWQKIRTWSVLNQPPWVQRMLDLALVTGQRRSDLAGMRFDSVWDGLLHINQEKTGARLALPLSLRLDSIGRSLSDVINDCQSYAVPGDSLLRKHNGKPMVLASLSARFEEARDGAGLSWSSGHPASLHECRSLAERLYRKQGINTMVLLGHKHQSMTDIYNDDRGLSSGSWKVLEL